ncbi:unannotated protein [freshwater metagenome]|uniref:Unannotated protein n=1 Tax=freshwater metagenome TaxID=449393 RepID=A0A6J5Z6H7_9ZZZZ|nr:hypothetical protein [Actinomycetota bacterium]
MRGGKLAFMSGPGPCNTALFGNAVYVTPGISGSVSVYDVPEDSGPTNVTRWTPNEFTSPTPQHARPARRSANFSSLANASRWQGGWSTSFASHYGQTAKPQHTALTKNNNPNTYGSKEQQRATVYNPWPSAGALYPKAV